MFDFYSIFWVAEKVPETHFFFSTLLYLLPWTYQDKCHYVISDSKGYLDFLVTLLLLWPNLHKVLQIYSFFFLHVPLALSRDGCFFFSPYFSVFPDTCRAFSFLSLASLALNLKHQIWSHTLCSIKPVFHQLSIVVAPGSLSLSPVIISSMILPSTLHPAYILLWMPPPDF